MNERHAMWRGGAERVPRVHAALPAMAAVHRLAPPATASAGALCHATSSAGERFTTQAQCRPVRCVAGCVLPCFGMEKPQITTTLRCSPRLSKRERCVQKHPILRIFYCTVTLGQEAMCGV